MGHRNGYFSAEEEEAIQEDIREKDPDFVFVGITSPKRVLDPEVYGQWSQFCLYGSGRKL